MAQSVIGHGTPLEAFHEKIEWKIEMIPGWFQKVLLDLIRMADSASHEWMLLGAVPVSYYGWPRATTDLDFSISADVSASDFVDSWMKGLGFEKEFGPEEIPGKGIWLSKF